MSRSSSFPGAGRVMEYQVRTYTLYTRAKHVPRFFQTVDYTVCLQCPETRDQRPKGKRDGRTESDNTDIAFQTMIPLVLATRLHDLPCLQPARKRAAVFLVGGQLNCGRNSCACLHPSPLSRQGVFLPFLPLFLKKLFF